MNHLKMKCLAGLFLLAAGCSGTAAGDGSHSAQEGASVVGAPGSCGPGSEAGAANDPCAGVRVAPDGVCGTGACDPDCVADPPSTDPCAAAFVAPDGVCGTGACDPDCIPVDDPCAAIDVLPDGVCSNTACDPDCLQK